MKLSNIVTEQGLRAEGIDPLEADHRERYALKFTVEGPDRSIGSATDKSTISIGTGVSTMTTLVCALMALEKWLVRRSQPPATTSKLCSVHL